MAHGESFIADSCSNVNSGYEGVRSTWNRLGGDVVPFFWTGKKIRKQQGWVMLGVLHKSFCVKVKLTN